MVCKVCSQTLPYSGNTTNLTHHIKHSHNEEYSLLAKSTPSPSTPKSKKKEQTMDYFVKGLYTRGSQRFKQCEESVMEYVCKDMEPLTTVDSVPFLRLLQRLDPRYKPSSRVHFTRVLLPAKYETVKASVTDTLSNASCCSLTTDMWTGCHSRSYMAVTAHIVSDDWEIKSFCLATCEVTSAHTANNIAAELSAVIAEWKLDTKVIGITTDNARNVKNAVDSLEFTHFGCIGHTLQLSINKGLQLGFVSRVLGHVHKLVEHFHKSTKATYALRQKQKLLGVAEHALVQQCETRWSSIFAMLERVVEQQQALCAVLLDSQDSSLLPDGAEWSVIEELMVILKPFALATTVLSGSSYGTISIVSPLIHKFCSNLDRKEDDSKNLKQIKVAIQSDLKERSVGDTAKLLQEAAFLDPRFKQLNFLSDDERRDTIERMKVKMLLAASDESLSCEVSEVEPHQSCS